MNYKPMRATHQHYLIDLQSRLDKELESSPHLSSRPTRRKNHHLFRVTTQSWRVFGVMLLALFCFSVLADAFGFSPYFYVLWPFLTDIGSKIFAILMCLLLLTLILESIH
jgi:hypothetical protein